MGEAGRLVQHFGFLKQSQNWLSIPGRGPPQARQALCWVPCSDFRGRKQLCSGSLDWSLFYLVLSLFGIHSSSLVPVAHSAYRVGLGSVENLGGCPCFISVAMARYPKENNPGEKRVILAHGSML